LEEQTDNMSRDMVMNDPKTINAWSFFDWANSSYSLVISTAVFPPFFTAIAPDTISIFGGNVKSSALYSFSVSFAFLLVAFLSPMLSGIADHSGKKLIFLKAFTIIGSVACASLFFFDDASDVLFGISAFIIGTVGFAGGLVFYNAFLPEIVTSDRYDNTSARGYAFGYVGSVILLIFILLMIQFPQIFGIEEGSTLPARLGFLLVGVWWLGFAQITFRRMPKDKEGTLDFSYVKAGFREVVVVFKELVKNKNVFRFLMSYLFFIAGVQTVIYVATIFAKVELNFETSELILVVLLLQLVASLGAYIFAMVSNKLGNKLTLLIQIFIWVVICVAAYFTTGKMFFYVVSAFVGLVLGGIQSLSRSAYSKMIDKHKDRLTSYFSFYDVLSKIAIVSGAFIFAMVDQLTGNMRYSVLSLGVLFIIGFVILLTVDSKSMSEQL